MENIYMLLMLTKAKPRERNFILQHGGSELMKTLSEIALNTLNGNNPVSGKLKAKLKRYKSQFRSIACQKRSLRSKRNIVQRGGFLPVLIGTVIYGIISHLLSGSNTSKNGDT